MHAGTSPRLVQAAAAQLLPSKSEQDLYQSSLWQFCSRAVSYTHLTLPMTPYV